MELFHKTSFLTSKAFTHEYSTSFSLGIMAFAREYRDPIYAIYGFVRLADEIVDTFHDYDRKKLLAQFRQETEDALRDGISLNPVIHAFQKTVREFNIDKAHIDAFLDSMEMDLYNSSYKTNEYNKYIYGSAEVVGLMCLKVFVHGSQEKFDELLMPAKALGSAFQKVNFLRDMKADLDERGRIYLPDVDKQSDIDENGKMLLEKTIDAEFRSAYEGIKKLPAGVRLGVYSAYLYYLNLFEKIKRSRVEKLLSKRIRVSNFKKLALLLQSIIEVKVLKTC